MIDWCILVQIQIRELDGFLTAMSRLVQNWYFKAHHPTFWILHSSCPLLETLRRNGVNVLFRAEPSIFILFLYLMQLTASALTTTTGKGEFSGKGIEWYLPVGVVNTNFWKAVGHYVWVYVYPACANTRGDQRWYGILEFQENVSCKSRKWS